MEFRIGEAENAIDSAKSDLLATGITEKQMQALSLYVDAAIQKAQMETVKLIVAALVE